VPNPWLRLLRPPNLFTVPGDPLAGLLLALAASGAAPSLPHALLVMVVSLLLYVFGLFTNDFFDLAEDRRDRPERPLPSGQASPHFVLMVASFLGFLALALASLVGRPVTAVALVLILAILLYNAAAKRISFLGPLNMGLCRGLSLLLGAAAAGQHTLTQPPVLIAAATLTLYVAAITHVARRETVPHPVGPARWLPSLTLLLGFAAFQLFSPFVGLEASRVLSAIIALVALAWSLECARTLAGDVPPARIAHAVGAFLRGLLFLQAAFVASSPGVGALIAAALLVLFPPASLTARRFYAS